MTQAFMLGNFGLGEIGIIILILLLLFGAKRLPQMARALGSSLTEFKKGRKDGARADAAADSESHSSRRTTLSPSDPRNNI